MIIRGGQIVSPREIGEFPYTHPSMLGAQVIGVPSDRCGDRVMAWRTATPRASMSADDIIGFFTGRISRFKIPRYVMFVETFPMTVTGKIETFWMREMAVGLLSPLDTHSRPR